VCFNKAPQLDSLYPISEISTKTTACFAKASYAAEVVFRCMRVFLYLLLVCTARIPGQKLSHLVKPTQFYHHKLVSVKWSRGSIYKKTHATMSIPHTTSFSLCTLGTNFFLFFLFTLELKQQTFSVFFYLKFKKQESLIQQKPNTLH
jgi:hypothetical protein